MIMAVRKNGRGDLHIVSDDAADRIPADIDLRSYLFDDDAVPTVSWLHTVHLSNAIRVLANRPAAEGWGARIQKSKIAERSEAIEIEMQEPGAGVTR
jgi:hypothetical protein